VNGGAWQFVLNETSVHFLLRLRSKPRERVLDFLTHLANDPLAKGDFQATDSHGRPIQIKLLRPFLISYWPDVYVKELRIINIEHI
jgi:hypothetical protein